MEHEMELATYSNNNFIRSFDDIQAKRGVKNALLPQVDLEPRSVDEFDGLSWPNHRIPISDQRLHRSYPMIDPRSGLGVVIGELGAGTYIVHPHTKDLLTPAFHSIEELTDERAIVKLGAQLYEIAPPSHLSADGLDDSFALFGREIEVDHGGIRYDLTLPTFLGASILAVNRLSRGGIAALNQRTNDLFGLREAPVDPLQQKATDLMGRITSGVFLFARRDRTVLDQLKDPNQATIRLPEVSSTELSAHLRLGTYEDGTSIVIMEGARQGTEKTFNRGFFLHQDESGVVTIINGSLDVVLAPGDKGYKKYLEQAEKEIETYFKLLGRKESADVLSADSLHDVRMILGGISNRKARKLIKKALAPAQDN